MVYSKLDCQFFGNSILAPFRMIGADATKQGYVLHWNWGAPDLTGPPTPMALEAAPGPSNHGLRFDHNQG